MCWMGGEEEQQVNGKVIYITRQLEGNLRDLIQALVYVNSLDPGKKKCNEIIDNTLAVH